MPSSRYYRFKTISKEERVKKRGVAIFWLFFITGFLIIMWAFFASPFFKITEIQLPNSDIVLKEDVGRLIITNRPLKIGENLLLLSSDRLKMNLAAAFPSVTNLKITKKLFHSVAINFEKRIQIGFWCNDMNCYSFDKEGIIFKEAPVSEGSLILKIKDNNKTNVLLGDRVLNQDLLTFIMEFNRKINDNNRVKIIEFKIKSASDLEAVTSSGWSIYLDQSQNPSIAVSNLIVTLDEAVKNKSSSLEYIDLRIPTRIFYRLR